MKPSKVTIIDYGVGNILSVKRSFEYLGATVSVSSEPSEIMKASRIVLPGVGAFPKAMNYLKELNLVDAIKNFVLTTRPLFAICLGMQLLMSESEEFQPTQGLNAITGKVVPISNVSTSGGELKIPFVSWSEIYPFDPNQNWNKTILNEIRDGASAYFVHSFMVQPEDSSSLIAYTEYGGHKINSVIQKDNIIGCQFHPEKSGKVGLKIIENFIKL